MRRETSPLMSPGEAVVRKANCLIIFSPLPFGSISPHLVCIGFEALVFSFFPTSALANTNTQSFPSESVLLQHCSHLHRMQNS